MKLKLLAATSLMVVVFGQTVKAEELPILERDKFARLNLIVEQTKPKPPEPPQPIEYIVVEGDTLEKVATAHQTSVERLFAKNTAITNPDLINVGDKLVVPLADEALAERPLPTPPPIVASASTTPVNRNNGGSSSKPVSRNFSSGNTYSAGYCTWYAKNMRSDIPNGLGNAITWASRAQAMGMSVGSTPRAGAIGQKGNHVFYVTSVNADGTFNLSEMNWKGRYVISARSNVEPAGHRFIY